MLYNTILAPGICYHPLGNTLAVSLTQDLPPEQDADILLLGCGDARNILFTCFADIGRKIDVTCCDVESAIHARNVLLYSLLIEDETNLNINRIWNIYYHWKIDEESVELLETQILKLLNVSESVDHWHDSVYGSSIRFCDERSLLHVRSYWLGCQFRDLSYSEKTDRIRQLQASIDRAKAFRKMTIGDLHVISDLSATYPVLDPDAMTQLSKVANQWWDCGTTPSSSESGLEATWLNPTFLYSPNNALTINWCLSPIIGFPLSSACIHVTKGSPFHQERENILSAENLVDCAKRHFKQWATAFRKALENKLVIRIFFGDALAFCWTLRHVQLTMPACSRSMDLFSNIGSNSPLKLHHADYHNEKNAAPSSFDIIDTSNLIDHLGPLNVIGICSSLLKLNICSTLYTETLFPHKSLSNFFGADVRTISLLLGLVLPDLFTNATDCFEDDLTMEKIITGTRITKGRARSRLCWKRLLVCHESENCTYVRVEAEALAKFLIQVHNTMFKYEDQTWTLTSYPSSVSASTYEGHFYYNRASFALLLNLLRATVISDWDECVKHIYDSCCCLNPRAPIRNCTQDLLLQMHLSGVDNGTFSKPGPDDLNDSSLASILPLRASDDLPEQLCVTIQVSREKFKAFTGRLRGIPALVCIFEGGDPSGMPWRNIFSAVQVTYGTTTWHEQTNNENAILHIDEDSSQLFGTSDMFVSVYVPTAMLLQSKQSVPWVKCGLSNTVQNLTNFGADFGPDLCFAGDVMTSRDVIITRYMPGVSTLPTFLLNRASQDKPTSAVTTVRLTLDGSKVGKLIRRISLDSHSAKAQLAIPSSTVEVKFKSPLTAFIIIAKSNKFKCNFPVPVSPSKYKVRIARKSSYIEVETPLFDPLQEDASTFIFPSFITKALCDVTLPVLWTSTRINLDAMPAMDLENKPVIPWLTAHVSLMYSVREDSIRKSESRFEFDIRTGLKDSIGYMIMRYTEVQPPHCDIFWICNPNSRFQILIFPSCLRLDLVNHSIVLDTAIIPLTKIMFEDSRAVKVLKKLCTVHGTTQMKVPEGEIRAWQAMMPALVERCRTTATWTHTPYCEYTQADEVPFSKGPSESNASPICSCGTGKFPPEDYLKSQKKRLPDLGYIVNRYATRVAVAPIFTNSYVEYCYLRDLLDEVKYDDENCKSCGKKWRVSDSEGAQGLFRCSRCKIVKYCSKKCQKMDWTAHKRSCMVPLGE